MRWAVFTFHKDKDLLEDAVRGYKFVSVNTYVWLFASEKQRMRWRAA